MPEKYKHIFFDLDHTLWDFDKNCTETLEELYLIHQLEKFPHFTLQEFISRYKEINNQMWKEYNAGKINKQEVRDLRFELTFDKLGVKSEDRPASINDDFLQLCPSKSNVMPFTYEMLDYLREKKYTLHIITNGFKETQHIKLASAGLTEYFSVVVNSEICGFMKPDRKIFQYALEKVSAECDECVMIGDDLFTDILGARNAGLDNIFFNPSGLKHEEKVTYEINCLSELPKIL